MWILLLSLLATESVQSASIGYPYGSFLTYNPQKSASIHGYLRYLDNYGDGDLVGYNDPQFVYALRQIKYINSAAPTPEATAIKNTEQLTKAKETYWRDASLQQYQHLKNDIDALKAEGQEPSSEKLSKLQTLEKIAFTSDFSLIAELPEVKTTLLDLQTSTSGLYREPAQQTSTQSTSIKQSTGEIKTYVGNTNSPTVAIEETPEQKKAREDHLRIYNKQIAHLKQLELEHQKYVQEANLKSNSPNPPSAQNPIDRKIDNSKALPEWEQATQEHLRLWNEAKLRAEQAGYKNGEKGVQKTANTNQQQISATTKDQSNYNTKQMTEKPESQQFRKQIEEKNFRSSSTSTLQHKQQLIDQAKLSKEHIQIFVQQQVTDTPEVVRAREEHLRIVNEAILRSQQEQAQQPVVSQKEEIAKFNLQSHSLKDSPPAINYRADQSIIEETPEVKKAREEHLRLVQEANQRAQYVEQQEQKYKQGSAVPILKSKFELQQPEQIHQPQISDNLHLENDAQLSAYLKEKNQKMFSFAQQQQLSESQLSGENAEVQSAREEHLRIFNSIKAHTEQEQTKQSGRVVPHLQLDEKPILDFAAEEERLLELERLREAERLQKEHQLLESDRLREAERLVEEKRQMDAELMRFRLEEEQRMESERLLEEKRLQQEQEELKALQNADYQEIVIQRDSPGKQEQIVVIPSMNVEQTRSQQNIEIAKQQDLPFASNPFLKVAQVSIEQEYRKTNPVQRPLTNSATQISDNNVPVVRYIQSSHHSGGSKNQYVKDDKVKHSHHDSAGYHPADTAVALIALEKATNNHFRAHELALEQLRLARIQNPSAKDCN